ncbi:hypothetical protein [Caulobacter sp. S45]|nr:hypothetical protein [Caulobacter sp. S45]
MAAAMVEIAFQLIEQQQVPFDPSQFTDRYEEALKGFVASKQRARTL